MTRPAQPSWQRVVHTKILAVRLFWVAIKSGPLELLQMPRQPSRMLWPPSSLKLALLSVFFIHSVQGTLHTQQMELGSGWVWLCYLPLPAFLQLTSPLGGC